MSERPILFNAAMVRAILAGTKTQTRRVVKDSAWVHDDCDADYDGQTIGVSPYIDLSRCPYGKPGDRLWVKEQTIKVEDHGWIGPVYTESDAGRRALEWGYGEPDDPDHIPPHAIKRRPSLFMTRAMSRITLEVTAVRVERLQEISDADAHAEGAEPREPATASGMCIPGQRRLGFRDLWQQINGPGSWDANPWVWVVEFERLEGSK